jgi:hypothetical protein
MKPMPGVDMPLIKSKINLSLGFTHNVYSAHDKLVNKFRDGSSFYSTLNGSYQFNDQLNSNGRFTFNRFANPQGTVRNTLSMNIGIQRKFFQKKFIVALNIIDPFRRQQQNPYTWEQILTSSRIVQPIPEISGLH